MLSRGRGGRRQILRSLRREGIATWGITGHPHPWHLASELPTSGTPKRGDSVEDRIHARDDSTTSRGRR
eukprot:11326072-Prorocentrum_lima.AAC.1